MEKYEIPVPKIFISYSWTSPEHEERVYQLAQRLVDNGVDVKFDKWDLKPGHDLYSFMESMVQSKDIDKVLIICDKGYFHKAENRTGGVGTETQIISYEVYADVKQEKFIPIIFEKDDELRPYIPTYIKTRMYIDLSSDGNFESEYEKLLRLLYERPEYRKPSLGQAPSWLFEDAPIHFKTANINKQIQDAMTRNPSRMPFLIREFVECYLESLNQFQIKHMEQPYDQQIMDKISDLLQMRDDYVNFLELLCIANEELDITPIITFFEEIYRFVDPPDDVTHYLSIQCDHYKFLIHELFIYTVAVMIENNQFKAIGELLKSEFFIKQRYERIEHGKYTVFYSSHPTLDEIRKQRLESRLFSIAAETIINRTSMKKYTKQKIVNADLILHYISSLDKHERLWFPILYIYGLSPVGLLDNKIDILQRLKSLRHFEKIKGLFTVSNIEELKQLLSRYEQPQNYRYPGSYNSVPSLLEHIKPEDIGTIL